MPSHHMPNAIFPSPLPLRLPHRPQLCAILPHQHRRRNANDQRAQAQHAISPPVPQSAVHGRRKGREHKRGDETQQLRARRRAGDVAREAVNHIHLHALTRQDDATGENADADVRQQPVRAHLPGPAVPEESDGHEQRARHHHGDAVLRGRDPAGAGLQLVPYAIHDLGSNLGGEGVADREGDVVESGLLNGLAVAVGPQLREGREHDVVDAEVIGHEDSHNLQRGLGAEET